MGGLSRKLPITFITFVVGALALIGCPPFSGFFSKDAILALAYERNTPIFAVALLTAFLTAFYVIRMLVIVFFGRPRSDIARNSRESPPVMTVPLIVLALLATFGGFAFFARNFLALPVEKEVAIVVPALAIVALIAGTGLSIALYGNRATEPLKDLELLRHKFYFDELYRWLIYWTQELLAHVSAFVDRPIIAAILIMVGMPARKTALAASVLTFLAAGFLLASFGHGQSGFQHVTSFTISREWRLSFTMGIDGLSLIMVLLATIVTVAAVWFAGAIERYENAFYACLLFISGGAIGAFASIDLFFFYAFHELALIPTFLLIGIWGSGNRVAAAWKITIYLAIGSFMLLLGLILLYQSLPGAARSFDIRALNAAAGLAQISADAQRHVYLLLLIRFGILISLFPFHTWAPEAYASAPAPAAMLHAGVLKKFGLYGLLRLAIPLLPEGAHHWANLLVVLLLGNIIYVGLVTIAQKRLDWML